MNSLLYFLLWAGFFFVMMRFGCGAHVMGHGHRHSGSRTDGHDPSPHDGQLAAPPGKAVDPVCHMNVETAKFRSFSDRKSITGCVVVNSHTIKAIRLTNAIAVTRTRNNCDCRK